MEATLKAVPSFGGQRETAAPAPTGEPRASFTDRHYTVTPQPGPIRLAVIDADSGFVRVLTNRLEGVAWEHRVLGSAPPIEELLAMRLNALVVDLALLGPQAWDFLERVCEALPGLGVVVCTGQSTVAQRVRGLRIGADDWVTKPCHPEEVIARVEAVVRRRKRATARIETGPMVAGELEVRLDQFQAFVGGHSVDLTRREFELLHLLAEAEGQVLQREEVYQRVWGYAMARGDRSVDVFVRKVRHKLERMSPGWTYIHTHFGIGYRFQPEQKGPDEGLAEGPASDGGDVAAADDALTRSM
jgi:DNA-binding response OmpR family regulator